MYGLKDPSALLRPFRNLTQFTEELYAMFSKPGDAAQGSQKDSGGETVTTTTISRPSEDAPEPLNAVRKARLDAARPAAAAIESPRADTHAAPARRQYPGDDHATTRRTADQTDRLPVDDSAPATKPRPALPTRNSQESTKREDFSPADQRPAKKEREFRPKPVLDIGNFAGPPGAGGGATTVLGKVPAAFTGDAIGDGYLSGNVTLYPDGPAQADGGTVPVNFLGVLLIETMPANTWIDNIQQYTDAAGKSVFYAIVPVWVS